MKSNLLKHLFSLLFICLAVSATAQSEERVYIKTPLTVEPGTSTANISFTLALQADEIENPYVGYQFDIVLPDGLEFDYNKSGKPRVSLVKTGFYPYYSEWEYDDETEEEVETKVYPHQLATSVVRGALRVIVYSAHEDENMRYFAKKSGDLVKVYVRPTAYLKPGEVNITLRDLTFAKMDATAGLEAAEMPVSGITATTTSTVNLTVSATNKFSTAVLPFDVAEIPAALEVYSCGSTSGENLVLSRQQSIKAYIPYILYAANGYSGTLTGTVDASKYAATVTDGYLTGTVVTQEIGGGNGYYVMQNKGDGPMFYRIDDETTFSIPAGKCWLTLPAELQGSVSFRLDGTTAIDEVKTESGNVKSIFDLTGHRVENPASGIYIINGKKQVIK